MNPTCRRCCLRLRASGKQEDHNRRACGMRWIGRREDQGRDTEYAGWKGILEEYVQIDQQLSFVTDATCNDYKWIVI